MTLDRIHEKLDQQGVKLWADGDLLRVRAPKGVLNPELQNLLRDRKAEILAWLHQNNGSMGEGAIDLSAEAVLDPTIYPEDKADEFGSEPTAILLTGATGFLGAFLLSELLRQSRAKIYCLVRAVDGRSARIRIPKKSRIISSLGRNLSQSNLPCFRRYF